MMNVEYKIYAPGQNWEQVQADIYNSNLKRMPFCIFRPVTAERIKARIEQEQKAPEAIRFAVTEDGKPLAYIQISLDGKRIWLGYPWAVPECPPLAQEKLYTDMLGYVKANYPEKPIVMGYISETWKPPYEFATKHGFQKCDTAFFYGISPEKMPAPPVDLQYQTRIAAEADIPLLLELAEADAHLRSQFKDMSQCEKYFRDLVIPTGQLLMVFHGGTLAAASAPLQFFYKGIMFRFLGVHPGLEAYWDALAYEMAQLAIHEGMQDPLLFTSFENWEFLKPKVEKIEAELLDTQVLYCLGTDRFEP